MAAIAALLLPTAVSGGSGAPSTGSVAPDVAAVSGADEGADFSQILQAMLIGAGLLQATPQSLATPQSADVSAEGSGKGIPGKAGACGLAGAVDLTALASDASKTLNSASVIANQQLQASVETTPAIAGGSFSQVKSPPSNPQAIDDASVPLTNLTIDATPQEPQVDAVDSRTAAANAMMNGMVRTQEPITAEPSNRDEVLPEAEPVDAANPMLDSENLILDPLKPAAESGTELRTAGNKKKDDLETLDGVGEADAVHGSAHSDSTHHVHAESKPHEVASPVSEQVRNRIIDHIETAREHGRVELSFDLHPPELGRMRLNLTSQDHSLSVRLWADSDQARQMLESQMDALKQRLAEGGISLGSFNVGRDNGGARLPYKPSESFVQPLTSAPADDASRSIARFRWAAGAGAVDVMA